ncbi:MAG: DEAD/DEAH box helicase [Phycisphaeraceae bacterium]|nr:DEAD/DEAH box helicase [Phycisphaeraceae bacterium]
MSLINLWSPFFPQSARRAGYPLFAEGEVTIQADPDRGRLSGQVRDGDQQAEVRIDTQDQNAIAHCSCEDFSAGRFCGHLWAVILTLQHARMNGQDAGEHDQDDADGDSGGSAGGDFDASREDSGSVEAEGGAASLEPTDAHGADEHAQPDAGSLIRFASLLAGLTPLWPRAVKREDVSEPVQTPRTPDWQRRLTRLGLLLQPDRQAPPRHVVEAPGQVLYALDTAELADHHRVVVYPYLRKMGQTGQWGASRSTPLDAEVLSRYLPEHEQELIQLLMNRGRSRSDGSSSGGGGQFGRHRIVVDSSVARLAIRRLVATGRLFLGEQWERPLVWDQRQSGAWRLVIECRWSASGGLEVAPMLERKGSRMSLDQVHSLVPGSRGLVFYPPWVAPLGRDSVLKWIRMFLPEGRFLISDARPLVVERGEVEAFLRHLFALPNLPRLSLPDELPIRPRIVTMKPRIELSTTPDAGGSKRSYAAQVMFRYGDSAVSPGLPGHYLTDEIVGDSPSTGGPPPSGAAADSVDADPGEQGGVDARPLLRAMPIQRDLAAERKATRLLIRLGFQARDPSRPHHLSISGRQAGGAISRLLRAGWEVFSDKHLMRKAGDVRLSVASGVDWFELSGGVDYQTADGHQVVPIAEILRLARSGQRLVRLEDGSQGLLPEAWLREHGMLAQIGQLEQDGLRFTRSQVAILDALLRGLPEVDIDEKFSRARRRLAEFERLEPIEATESFRGDLRTYQKIGLGWLAFLRAFEMGGILADDMGLGKTIQVLAWLDHLRRGEACAASEGRIENESGNGDGLAGHDRKRKPFLVVAPRSVVFNWLDEAVRFTPHLKVIGYTGADRDQLRQEFDTADLIVTSYGLLRRDVTELHEYEFDTLVLDEAQSIKNPGSQGAKAARLLKADHRLALTGTPVENHLGDLWSIFEFLNPGLLGSGSKFNELIKRGPGLLSVDAARHAGRALRPFILRRTKKQVLTELPEKTEQTLICGMDEAQREIYDGLKKHYQTTLLNQVDAGKGGVGRVAFQVLEALLRLRQACCHPGLIDARFSQTPSAKLETLIEQVQEIREEGYKALIFSQFTSFLAYVRQAMDERGMVYEYLDGQTRDRKTCVDRFQTDPDCGLFLISLKAGGLGLNLTAAEYVFILDPWWNPAVEQQAIDRAHRIGQTRNVTAYRLICEDTVEQRIAELQMRKQQVADAIIEGQESLLGQLTRDDLEQLLR